MISYGQWITYLLPEVALVCAGLFVLMLDVIVLRRQALRVRLGVGALLGTAGCLAAGFLIHLQAVDVRLADGLLVLNPTMRIAMMGIVFLTIITLLLSTEMRGVEDVGEYYLLILLAATGMLLVVSTMNLLVFFVSLELLSLSLYLLVAFDKHRRLATEASLKYFLFGAMSAAILLYGFSLLYGFANSADLMVIASVVASHVTSPVVILAVVTVFVGLGFKVAAAPFHFWVPDVYQCAPAPVVGLIASASKLASFYALFLFLTLGFGSFAGSAGWHHISAGWAPVCAALATLSMLIGNVGAIAQTSVRRLLGYSAIAHSGYMLIAVTSGTMASRGALLFYLITYSVSVLGAFAVAGALEQETGSDQIANFDGLSRRMPALSACMFVFLLSQAGIPPLAGFFGKFYLFSAAVAGAGSDRGLLWLVVFALAMSAVSLYYYLQVLKRIFVHAPAEGAARVAAAPVLTSVVVMLAALTLFFGIFPNALYKWIQTALTVTHF